MVGVQDSFAGALSPNQASMRAKTSSPTAASPPRTAARRPRRGDHNVPVCTIRGRIHTVFESVVGTRPRHRQSETITCVAPIDGARANPRGTASLTPPSVSRNCSSPSNTDIGGNSRGIEALARTAWFSVTRWSKPVAKHRGRPTTRSWQTIPSRWTP